MRRSSIQDLDMWFNSSKRFIMNPLLEKLELWFITSKDIIWFVQRFRVLSKGQMSNWMFQHVCNNWLLTTGYDCCYSEHKFWRFWYLIGRCLLEMSYFICFLKSGWDQFNFNGDLNLNLNQIKSYLLNTFVEQIKTESPIILDEIKVAYAHWKNPRRSIVI